MSQETRKKVDKIYTKLDALAKKGKDNVFEYYKYIDDLINSGDYGYFEQALYYHYKIDIVDSIDIESIKKSSWKEILFQTNSSFSTRLKKMYDSNDVYQISTSIYTTSMTSSSIFLGDIKEIDAYPEDAKFLTENRDFSKLAGYRVIFLEVSKVGAPTASMITENDPSLSSDQNLLNRYTTAVTYLLS